MLPFLVHPAFLLIAVAVMGATPLIAGHRVHQAERMSAASGLERLPGGRCCARARQRPAVLEDRAQASEVAFRAQVLTLPIAAMRVRAGIGALAPPQG